ncbi:DUF2989 domain-containing protein [Vibrio sp. WXL103]|uniref:DUF2989 domain-containing protein n=1 Tax=Vibrio sp. WXL103 TaxID=3450710 RepID=UPI003EC8BDC6
MKIQLLRPSILVACTALLSGCFEQLTETEQLCRDNPELECQQLNIDDSQCHAPRYRLLAYRAETPAPRTDIQQIREYELVSDFRSCLELAAQIEPIDRRDRKTARFETMMSMRQEQKRLIANIKDTQSAHALYFAWIYLGEESARRQFLRLEGEPELDTAELQYALATFYTTRDPAKAEQMLHRAIELSMETPVNRDIFTTLSTLYYRTNQIELAYLWSMVAKHFGVAIASERELEFLYQNVTPQQKRQLDQQSLSIVAEINSQRYRNRSIAD